MKRENSELYSLFVILGIFIASVIIFILDFFYDFDNDGRPEFGLFILETIWYLFLLAILLALLSPILDFLIICLLDIYLWIFDRNEYINQKNRREKIKLQEAKRERKRIARERRKYEKEQSELDRKWKERTGKRDPLLRELAENIFSDIRDYDIWFSGANPHRLKIEVFVNGDIREFTYGDIYHRDIEDIEREMKADKISPKPRPRYRSSRYYDGASDVGDSGSDLGDTMDE